MLDEDEVQEVIGVRLPDGSIGPLPAERALAIQLSHNSIAGRDDPAVLEKLYAQLPFGEKLYSGVTDDMIRANELDVASLSAGPPQYQEVMLVFLPEHAEAFQALLQRLGDRASRPVLACRYDDFAAFFDAVVRTKGVKNVYNTAMAVRTMVDLVNERLDQEERGERAEQPERAEA